MSGQVFINYRKSTSLKDAQLLKRELSRALGTKMVFLDESGLDGGDHWLHTLERQVDASAVMVTLIGPGWSDVTDEAGTRRLDNPNDFVRFEIARALSRPIPVLPVLTDGATMPGPAELPTNLLPLTFSQAMLLRSASLADDAEKIAKRLRILIRQGQPTGVSRGVVLTIAAFAVAAGLAAGLAVGPNLGRDQADSTVEQQRLLSARDQARKEASEQRAVAAQRARDLDELRNLQATTEAQRDQAQRDLQRSRLELAEATARLAIAESKISSLSSKQGPQAPFGWPEAPPGSLPGEASSVDFTRPSLADGGIVWNTNLILNPVPIPRFTFEIYYAGPDGSLSPVTRPDGPLVAQSPSLTLYDRKANPIASDRVITCMLSASEKGTVAVLDQWTITTRPTKTGSGETQRAALSSTVKGADEMTCRSAITSLRQRPVRGE